MLCRWIFISKQKTRAGAHSLNRMSSFYSESHSEDGRIEIDIAVQVQSGTRIHIQWFRGTEKSYRPEVIDLDYAIGRRLSNFLGPYVLMSYEVNYSRGLLPHSFITLGLHRVNVYALKLGVESDNPNSIQWVGFGPNLPQNSDWDWNKHEF